MNAVVVVVGLGVAVIGIVGGGMKFGDIEVSQRIPRTTRTVLTLLGLAILAVGLMPSLLPTGGSDPDASSASPTPPPATTSTTPATVTPSSTQPPQPEAPIWQGSLLFDVSGINFGTDPPGKGKGPAKDVSYNPYGGTIQAYGFGLDNVVKWTEQRRPTADDCAAQLNSHGVNSAPIDTGDRICVHSRTSDRIALITLTKKTEDAFEVAATVWRPRP